MEGGNLRDADCRQLFYDYLLSQNLFTVNFTVSK